MPKLVIKRESPRFYFNKRLAQEAWLLSLLVVTASIWLAGIYVAYSESLPTISTLNRQSQPQAANTPFQLPVVSPTREVTSEATVQDAYIGKPEEMTDIHPPARKTKQQTDPGKSLLINKQQQKRTGKQHTRAGSRQVSHKTRVKPAKTTNTEQDFRILEDSLGIPLQ